jgi:hypothetical protein
MEGSVSTTAESGVVKTGAKPSLRKLALSVSGFFVVFVAVIAILLFAFGGAFINGYAKNTVEKSFAQAHPGLVMRIGHLSYSIHADETVAVSIRVSGSNMIFKVDRIKLKGVRWISLFLSKPVLASVLAKASLDATNLEVVFPTARYRVHCARLQTVVPDADLTARGIELRALADDKDFFSAHEFRATRFQLLVPECQISGVACGDLFEGTSFRAASVYVIRPAFDALVDCDKPVNPFAPSPLMAHEALAAILKPLQIDSLRIDDGSITYNEQKVAGGNPGVLTFTAVSLAAQNIANRGAPTDAIKLQAQGNLMNQGTLRLLMTIPIAPTNFSLRYSGSLGPMNLTNLDAFLDIDAHTRITSGFVKEADFEIDVTAGRARGHVRGTYEKLEIAVLDAKSGVANGIEDRITSFLVNMLKIRSSNNPELSGLAKEGEVNYTRKPNEEFQQFLWFALRTGVLDIISH